ncbi:hypothetical protein DNTS_017626 [Danionella cerebrum]|uniref:Uncharacterized protein n=1 Tax=Danionella cerebrum TaxID=2873325 RepID=A0A553N271_9TELE|nr:hypothetical protein DNTS_017626 [Danionella translucida]
MNHSKNMRSLDDLDYLNRQKQSVTFYNNCSASAKFIKRKSLKGKRSSHSSMVFVKLPDHKVELPTASCHEKQAIIVLFRREAVSPPSREATLWRLQGRAEQPPTERRGEERRGEERRGEERRGEER